mmetsp:Transcript_28934/g.92486  ORF Transcript_28934/g.92486 Transcript_28934/m.92486 type:complete len:315 (+) Transcript_28934:2692-3636(+)
MTQSSALLVIVVVDIVDLAEQALRLPLLVAHRHDGGGAAARLDHDAVVGAVTALEYALQLARVLPAALAVPGDPHVRRFGQGAGAEEAVGVVHPEQVLTACMANPSARGEIGGGAARPAREHGREGHVVDLAVALGHLAGRHARLPGRQLRPEPVQHQGVDDAVHGVAEPRRPLVGALERRHPQEVQRIAHAATGAPRRGGEQHLASHLAHAEVRVLLLRVPKHVGDAEAAEEARVPRAQQLLRPKFLQQRIRLLHEAPRAGDIDALLEHARGWLSLVVNARSEAGDCGLTLARSGADAERQQRPAQRRHRSNP